MVLAFKKEFKDQILSGSKIHTIRTDKPDKWHKDTKIHFATGVRTPDYDCFMRGECTGIERIKINPAKALVEIEGIRIKGQDLLMLANNDGFESVIAFLTFFMEPFEGKIIHWTDFRYANK